MLKLSLLGNCQIEPLGMCLKFMSPEVEVILQKVTISDTNFTDSEISALSNSDIILSIEKNFNEFKFPKFHDSKILLPVPSIFFDAFHPDAVYAKKNNSWIRNGLDGDWQSGLLIWCYKNGSSISQYLELMEDSYTLESLGYKEHWASSCKFLENEFKARNFDFNQWISSVRRRDTFMWGINHPKLFAVAELAKQILAKINVKAKVDSEELILTLTDPLENIIWPVHSVIANHLGVTKTDLFRQGNTIVNLEDFAIRTMDSWKRKHILPDEIVLVGGRTNFKILTEIVK